MVELLLLSKKSLPENNDWTHKMIYTIQDATRERLQLQVSDLPVAAVITD